MKLAILMMLTLAWPCLGEDLADRKTITAKEAAVLTEKVTFLDVRTTLGWLGGHVKGAVHIPHDEVAEGVAEDIPDRATPIVAYCGSGRRAASIVESLRQQGYTVVAVVNGGYSELVEAGMAHE
jgi:rhodanese-related sulfurtransferase|tara:strand:+ start:40 stop:411 length:372 start_codon:yes stop_codon:yes gene_type:complete